MTGKCDVYSDKCKNWDGKPYTIIPSGIYPKSKRLSEPLYVLRYKNKEKMIEGFLVMCASCKFESIKKYRARGLFNEKTMNVETGYGNY